MLIIIDVIVFRLVYMNVEKALFASDAMEIEAKGRTTFYNLMSKILRV